MDLIASLTSQLGIDPEKAQGLAWAVLYLLFLPVGTITLDEFQPRLFAASALLGAYWFYRRGRALAFWRWRRNGIASSLSIGRALVTASVRETRFGRPKSRPNSLTGRSRNWACRGQWSSAIRAALR